VLTESHAYKGSYSSVKRRIKELELNHRKKDRRAVEGESLVRPGEEMQHDTSPYVLDLGGKKRRLECSELYFRYSKMRYTVFYPSFDRFTMKAFFHEALTYFGYSADRCVIDNTHLAVLRGTGKNAIFVPEMIAFGKSMGFTWLAHERMHSDRKGGKERGFRTINENFLPGRAFKNLQDLNQQAFNWATQRFAKRPLSKTGLIPLELFEQEKSLLNKIPEGFPPPYREHTRTTDEYGYFLFRANFYWTPGTRHHEVVKVIEYPKLIRVYLGREFLLEYLLPPEHVRHEKIKPPGVPSTKNQPHSLKLDSSEEEKKLRLMSENVSQYIRWARKESRQVSYPNKWIRALYDLSRQLAPTIFNQTIERAMQYQVTKIDALERMASLLIRLDSSSQWLPDIPVPSNFDKRKAYEEGRFSEEPDLKTYADLMRSGREDDDDSEGETSS